MILVAFHHGLRSSELTDLRWDQVDFTHALLHVRRAKKGTPATHPVVGDEMRALPSRRSCSPASGGRLSRRQALRAWWSALVSQPSWASGSSSHAAPRLWFCAGANKGHDTRALQAYLGHRNIQHTVRYTELSPERFKDFWR
jgi:integrase